MKSPEIQVSIITIVYNGSEHVEQTIKSILNQTYKNIEYIIIDGGSTDGTIEIIKRYDTQLKWISEKDNGIADAFNKGVRLAKGQLIALVNADDWYEVDAVESFVNSYVDDDTILSGNIRLYNDEKRFNIKYSTLTGIEKLMTIWHPATIIPRSVYDKIGEYDVKYKVAMDYDFVLRCHFAGVKFKIIDKIISNMRYGGLSNKLISRSTKETLEIKNRFYDQKVKNYFQFLFYTGYYHGIIFLKKLIYKK